MTVNCILCLCRPVAGKFLLVCPCVGGKTSLMSSSLLLRQCPSRLVRLPWMGSVMESKWPHCCYFLGCCFQNLFNITRSILVQFSSGFFTMCFISVHVVHLLSSIDTTLLGRNPVLFYQIDQTSIWLIAYWWQSTSLQFEYWPLSGDNLLLRKYENMFTNFRGLLFRVEMSPFRLRNMYSILFTFMKRAMLSAACSSLCSSSSA